MALLSSPLILMRHQAEWTKFVETLPDLAAAAANATSTARRALSGVGSHRIPPAGRVLSDEEDEEDPGDSVTMFATHTCAKWSVLATEIAFFDSVAKALTVTPFFSMGAIAIFSRYYQYKSHT